MPFNTVNAGHFIMNDKKEDVGSYGALSCFIVIFHNLANGMRYCSHIAKANDPLTEVSKAFDSVRGEGGGRIVAGIASIASLKDDELLNKETEALLSFLTSKKESGEISELHDYYGKSGVLGITSAGEITADIKKEDFAKKMDFNMPFPPNYDYKSKISLVQQGGFVDRFGKQGADDGFCRQQ